MDLKLAFCEALGKSPDTHLQELRNEAEAGKFPLIDDYVGNLLALFASERTCLKVLDLGSGFGYSALWLLSNSNASITLVDYSEERLSKAAALFKNRGLEDKISRMYAGNALDFLDSTEENWDLIFVDVDKSYYFSIWERVRCRLNPKGIVAFDNIFLNGRIFEKSENVRKKAAYENVSNLLKDIHENLKFHEVLIPSRDGLLVARAL